MRERGWGKGKGPFPLLFQLLGFRTEIKSRAVEPVPIFYFRKSMRYALRIALKVGLILVLVIGFGVLMRTFGFQFLNSVMVTSSAPPPDLDKRLVILILIMSCMSLIFFKDWIKK